MKSKLWTLINEILLALLFSLGASFLLQPWLNSLNRVFGFGFSSDFLQLWMVAVIFITIHWSKYLARINRELYRKLVIGAYLILNILLLRIIEWPLIFFTPLLLILILTGLRFRFYSKSANFNTDFFAGVLFLLFNIILRNRLGFNINYANVILFFAIGICLSVLFNLKGMQHRGYATQFKPTLIMILVFAVMVVIVAFILGLPLQPTFFQGILNIIGWIYDIFAQLLLAIIYPIVWLLAPLMQLIMSFEPEQQPEDESQSMRDPEEMRPDLPEKAGEKEPLFNTQIIAYIIYAVLIVLMALLVAYVVKKLWERWKNRSKEEEGYTEERKSLFTMEEFKNDLNNLWSGIKSRFTRQRQGKKSYDGSDPALIIREIYYRFLLRYQVLAAFYRYNTPIEYLKKITGKIGKKDEENKQDKEKQVQTQDKRLKQLTELYNKARYSESVTEEDIENARELWEKIRKEKPPEEKD
ncbi:MAG: hypothetical protein ACOCQN_04310 [Halanaerobiaceae bacterium]